MKRLLFILPFLVVSFLFSCKGKQETVEKYNYLLVDKNGKEIPLPKNKIIFINFMAYSCSACMKELPLLKKVLSEKQYRDKVAFIGCVIDADKNDLSDKNFPFYSCNKANFVRFPVPGTPTTYIISPDGKKLIVVYGAFTEKNLRKFLDKAIKKYYSLKREK